MFWSCLHPGFYWPQCELWARPDSITTLLQNTSFLFSKMVTVVLKSLKWCEINSGKGNIHRVENSSVGKGIWCFWKYVQWGLLSLKSPAGIFLRSPHLSVPGVSFPVLWGSLCGAAFPQLRCLALAPCWTWPCTLPGLSCSCPALLLGASCQTSQPLSNNDV